MRIQSYLDSLTDRPKAVVLFAHTAADECWLRELKQAFDQPLSAARLIIDTTSLQGQQRVATWQATEATPATPESEVP